VLRFTGPSDDILRKAGLHEDSWHEPGMPNRENSFLQNRAAMRNGAYSGLPNFFPEDAAVLVSSGAIRDRSKEILAPADVAIARLYRTLLNLVRAHEEGRDPTGLRSDLTRVRPQSGVIEPGEPSMSHWARSDTHAERATSPSMA
jgi:hypothetical protein